MSRHPEAAYNRNNRNNRLLEIAHKSYIYAACVSPRTYHPLLSEVGQTMILLLLVYSRLGPGFIIIYDVIHRWK